MLVLGSFWTHYCTILGSVFDNFGMLLGYCRGPKQSKLGDNEQKQLPRNPPSPMFELSPAGGLPFFLCGFNHYVSLVRLVRSGHGQASGPSQPVGRQV